MYNIPKSKTGNCNRCPNENVPVRKRGRELVCLKCCQREDVARQIEKAKTKPILKKEFSKSTDSQNSFSGHTSFDSLVEDIDKYFSQYIRLKEADKFGYNYCYTSGVRQFWKQLQCGHYIPRTHLLTRWDERNCRPQSKHDNEFLAGNLKVYTEKLEQENKGITDELFELSRQVWKPSISDLKELLHHWRNKAKLVQSKLVDQETKIPPK